MTQQTTVILDLVKEDEALANTEVYQSYDIDLDRMSGEFCAQMTVKNAVSAEFKMIAELSVDGKDYVEAFSEDLTIATGGLPSAITDPKGYTALFDFNNGSGAGFLRLTLEMVSGALDLTRVMVKGKESR